MTNLVGFTVKLEATKEFLKKDRCPLDYLSSRVLVDHRVIKLLTECENVSIEGPEVKTFPMK